MGFQLSRSEDGTFVEMRVSGDVTRESALEQNQAAHEFGRNLGILKFFVDLTEARNAETVGNTYDLAYKDMKGAEGILPGAVVAMLVRPDDHSHDFVETVFQNSGQNVRLFRDRAMALDFLRSATVRPQ